GKVGYLHRFVQRRVECDRVDHKVPPFRCSACGPDGLWQPVRRSTQNKNPQGSLPEGFAFREAGIYLFSQAVSSQLSSAQVSLTSVFGMGTGGTSPSSTPAVWTKYTHFCASCPDVSLILF